ncbi:MAG: universal stress protein [Chlorobiaceae bacterium]|nr:universal stress protein [Chlorobiaceae bacterium]NTW10929.1 universal stress protein [Chlorobiaceae bacterium]
MSPCTRTILCPVDFSPGSEAQLRYCSEFHSGEAEIIVLHVADPEEGDRETLMKEYLHIFSRYSDELSSFHCRLRFALDYGTPSTVITAFAEAHRVDLIVIGSHGSTGIRRLLVGSTAEKIMRESSCPVAVLKLPELRAGAEAVPA